MSIDQPESGGGRPLILILSASSRRDSHTASLASHLAGRLEHAGAQTVHWDLIDLALPPADPAFHHRPTEHPDSIVRDLVGVTESADGIVLASPVYHNSYSATLKLALDHLAIAQFWYKPVSLISHGERRNTQAVDHLRIVVRGLLGIALPAQVCTDDEDYVVDSGALSLCNPQSIARAERVAIEMVLFARSLRILRDSLAP